MFRELSEVRMPEAFFGAVVSGCAAVSATLSDITVQIVGVPLPVLMAAIAGAFIVMAFAEVEWKKAAAIFLAMVFAGCAGAPLLEAITLWAAKRYEVDINIPGGMRTFAALAISSSPFWLPKAWPYIKGFIPEKFLPKDGGKL